MAKDRILIVEDNESLILFYKGILSTIPIAIDTAKSYDEAIVKLKDHDYCFHIIDIMLDGEVPGTDLIGKCGADPESCLILSSTMTETRITELVEVFGVPRSLIMTKPVEADLLTSMIKNRLTDNSFKDDVVKRKIMSSERFVLTHVWMYFKQHWMRTTIFIIFFIVFMHFLITFWKIDAYNEVYNKIKHRNEELFTHFNKSTNITGSSYAEFSGYDLIRLHSQLTPVENVVSQTNVAMYQVNEYIKSRVDTIKRVNIKFYPDDNYLIVITDENGRSRHVWISDLSYLDSLGIGKDLNWMEMIVNAWSASFKNF